MSLQRSDRIADIGEVARESVGGARVLGALARSRLGLAGGLVTALVLVSGVAGLIMIATPGLHHLYLDQDLSQGLRSPSMHHIFGTDSLGRDLFFRVIGGTGVSLGVAAAVTLSSLLVGGALGILAGYFGGKLDLVVSGVVDVTWGFPIILLAVVLAGVLKPGLITVVLSISLINWAGFARIVRGEVLTLREREFVKAARALGVSNGMIMLRHLVPNVIAPTLVMGTYYVAIAIIAEAGLSFIGVGAQPPTPSLGQIISEGQNYWSLDLWIWLIPGVVLALAVTGLNAFGDGLRDVLDPTMRVRG